MVESKRIGIFLRAGIAAIVLCVIPSTAHAFPVAEGAGALSSLIGVLTSVIVGFFPKSGIARTDRKFATAVSIALVACLIAAGSLFWVWVNAQVAHDWEVVAAQSRPNLELAGEIRKKAGGHTHRPLNAQDAQYAARTNLFIDLAAYRRGEISPHATRVLLDHDPRSRRAFPYFSVTPLAPGDDDGLIDLVRKHDGDILLVATDPKAIIRAARAVEAKTGYQLQGIPLRTKDFSLKKDRQTNGQGGQPDYPVIHDPEHIFDRTVIDLRPHHNIIETHTLINARNITATDFLLMRDSELISLFEGHGEQPIVLIGYNEFLYPKVNERLRNLVPGKYVFYQGGLEAHFLQDHLTITPYYYNMRFVAPGALTDLYALSGKVKFLCTSPGTCLNNIPVKDRVELPFRNMDKQDFFDALEALPKDKIYVSVTTNQETYGNALMAGYSLVKSGHDYAGNLVMPERFSLEEVRAKIVSSIGYEPSLEEWRAQHWIFLSTIDTLHRLVMEHGWLLVFAGLGVCVRFLLSPFQIIVFGSYYKAHHALLPMLAAAVAIPGVLVACYQFLDKAISYYAVVPHHVMNEIQSGGQVARLLPWFVAMICLQVMISFPRRPKAALPIILLVVTAWFAGWMDALPMPLLVFLMASEGVAIALQIPFFTAFLLRIRAEGQGITVSPMPERSDADYPAKWFKLTAFRPQPGFLVDLRGFDLGTPELARQVRKLRSSDRLIVRSAALDAREETLGGYYASHVTLNDLRAVQDALTMIRKSGCEFAWIQPFVEAEENGVLSSISREGRRGECVFGPGDSATEGSREAETAYLDTPGARRKYRAEWRLLRAAERHAGGPVVLEYGRIGRKVIPYQLRLLHPAAHPEAKLWPQGAESYTLAEDYLARCSRITAEVIEEATGGLYKGLRGFLYRRKRGGRRGVMITRKEVSRLEQRAVTLLMASCRSTPLGPGETLRLFEDGISLLKDLFRTSQARIRPSDVITTLNPAAIETSDGPELEILSRKFVDLDQLSGVSRHAETRTHLHDLIVVTTAALSRLVESAYPFKEWRARIGLDDMRGASEMAPPPAQLDTHPVTAPDHSNTVIVAGEIIGHPWPADNKVLPPQDGTRWILAGEEISSDWVRHLDMFAGILSVYGHPNAHLGLSARALGLPYRRISQEDLSVFLSAGNAPE